MTNEEWDRKTEFLLNQQAKFDAGMQDLKEAQAISERKLAKAAETADRVEEGLEQLTDVTADLINTMTAGFRSAFDRIKHSNDRIDVLVNSQIHSDERIRESYNRMKASEKILLDHDKRLQDLTTQFERYIRKYPRRRNSTEN